MIKSLPFRPSAVSLGCIFFILFGIGEIHAQYALYIPDQKKDTIHIYPKELSWIASKVINHGDQATPEASLYSYFYLSNDTIYDGEDISLGYDASMISLASGATNTIGKVLELRENVPTSNYFLIQHTYLDIPSSNPQEKATVTRSIAPCKVYPNRIGPLPELMALISLLEDTIVAPGGSVLARSYNKNVGQLTTKEGYTFYTHYLLLPEGQTDTANALVVGSETFSLPMNTENGIYMDEVLNFPKDLPEGNYQLYLVIDPYNNIDEALEDNNLSYFGNIEIKIPWWKHPLALVMYVFLSLALLSFLFINIRRRWKLRRELIQQQREAERIKELDAFKTRLNTNITHEFRTPLTLILGMAHRLKDKELAAGFPGL